MATDFKTALVDASLYQVGPILIVEATDVKIQGHSWLLDADNTIRVVYAVGDM